MTLLIVGGGLGVYASNLHSGASMKILHTVEFYAPAVGGAEEVVRQISIRLAARGHDVTVATSHHPDRADGEIDGVKVIGFDVRGNAAYGYTGADVDRYRSFLRESRFDVVMNYAAQEWTADLFFDVIDEVDAKKVFVPCGFSGLYDPRYAGYFERMSAIMKRYDANVFLGEHYRDADFAREHGVANGHLIPNGAAEEEFGELSGHANAEFRRRHGIEGLLVTTLGNHTGAKGHAESIRAFMRARTGPATLLVLGGAAGRGCARRCRRSAQAINLLGPVTGKRALLLHPSRSETVQALKASDVFLFLSNVECSPIVLFEAAAAQVPFVAGPAGNAEEIARWTGGGVIVDAETRPNGLVSPSVRSAAAHLEALARDPERRRALGASGRAAWQERFTWETIAGAYLDLYERLVHDDRRA